MTALFFPNVMVFIGHPSTLSSFDHILRIARPCAVLCLALSILGSGKAAFSSQRGSTHLPATARFSFSAALSFGAVAGIITLLLLTMRAVYAFVDLVRGFDASPSESPAFTGDGLWVLGCLFVACAAAMPVTRTRALATCAYWLSVQSVLWYSLLGPVYITTETGRIERTPLTILALAGLAAVTLTAVLLVRIFQVRRQWQIARTNADDLTKPTGPTRGFRLSCSAVALLVLVLVSYHLAVPTPMVGLGARTMMLITGGASLATAAACFLLVERSWSSVAADAGIALTSLTICALLALLIQARPAPLIHVYPALFTVMIIGFALSAALWGWLTTFWRQQLLDTAAWTTAGRMIPHARGFAFVNAALGLVLSALLSVWPRLPWVAAEDEPLSRLLAGLFANLLLLLVILWCSRILRRLTFLIMTLLALGAMVSFVVLRIVPFTSWTG